MPLETANFIDGLVATNPAATDGLADADNHMRLIKAVLKNSFPSIAGAVNATHTELNTLDGDTAATSTTLVDADRLVVNDNGTMVQVELSDLLTYLSSNLNVTSSMITNGTIQSADIAAGAITADKMASNTGLPAGCIMAWTTGNAPTGWLLCGGQDVSRTIYPDLFAAIATTYGAGDGSTTFNVPDLRGRVIAGLDDMGGGGAAGRLTAGNSGISTSINSSGGSAQHTLTESEMPAHTHSGNVNLRTNWESGYSTLSPVGTGSARYDGTGTSPPLTINSTGGGAAHNNVQPTLVLQYIIKT